MYADGLSFLDEEREAWRPFEVLLDLTDEQLEQPVDGAHGWTGRDLMAHLGVWLQGWRTIAAELALGPQSPAFEWLRQVSADWDAQGDQVNGRAFNAVAWVTTVTMIALTLLLVANGFGLKLGV